MLSKAPLPLSLVHGRAKLLMAKRSQSTVHRLDQPWPAFLDRLDSDPHAAFREFYSLAWRLLASCPPTAMRDLPQWEREEVIAEVILHCWQDDQRVLRTYRDRGVPFGHWLLMVTRCKALDYLRARNRNQARHQPIAGLGPPQHGAAPLACEALADVRLIMQQNLELVHRCIQKLGPSCQILLLGSTLGLKPREMTSLLGWGPDMGKKVSDSLRHCRGRLKDELRREGVDWRELVRDGARMKEANW